MLGRLAETWKAFLAELPARSLEKRHAAAPFGCAAPAVPKDMQLARRIRGPIYGICSY